MTIRSLLRHVEAIKWYQMVCPACLRIRGPLHWAVYCAGVCDRGES